VRGAKCRLACCVLRAAGRRAGLPLLLVCGLALAQDAPGAVSAFDRSVLRELTHRADSLLYARQFTAAESAYAVLLTADTGYAPGYLGIATARFYAGGRDPDVILRDFRRAAVMMPSSTIAHLRYGEALLPWRLPDRDPDSARLAESVRQLHRALELSPSRVEALPALYFAYLAQSDRVRAETALQELATRDFFPKPVRDFGYDLLVSADSNSYVFVNGDLDLFSALALQAAGMRTDVTVASIPMLGQPWYVRYLKQERNLPVSLSDEQLESRSGRYDQRLARTLSPAECVLENALANRGKVKGGIYLPVTVRREILELFQPSLSLEGFVYRVTDNKSVIPVNEKRCDANLNRDYRDIDFQNPPVWRANSSPLTRNYSALARDCAAAWWALADEYRFRGDNVRAGASCHKACSILLNAGEWESFEKVLEYWLQVAPQDPGALRMKQDYYGK
jgi:tetratricopeptide (TPR) repeat protein